MDSSSLGGGLCVLVHTLLPFHPLKLIMTVDQRPESQDSIKQTDLLYTTKMSHGREGVSTKDIRVSHFCHYCDIMPGKSHLRKEGLFWLTVHGHSPLWWGNLGGSGVGQLVTLCPQSESRDERYWYSTPPFYSAQGLGG